MIGISSFGAYLPFFRLNRGAIANGLKGERPFANFDEDSITMAVAAVMDCLRGVERENVDGLFFASTTSPYREKQASTTIAVATDLQQDIITADYANSLKAGTSALRSAADAVAAGTARQVMVAAADIRMGAPGSLSEQSLGDGAAAILMGKDDVVATLEGSYSLCHEIMDTWRIDGSRYIRSWEARFTGTEGYQKTMYEAVSGVLKQTAFKPEDITKVIFYTPDARASARLAGKLGFDPESQLQDPHFGLIGDAGTPYAMMLLVAALEESKPGDILLLANYGNGADAFIFKVTEKVKDLVPRGGMKQHLASRQVIDEYRTYLYYRGILPGIESIYPVPYGHTSAPALFREVDKNLRFHGGRCDNCGTVQYPPQRTCVKCRTKDQFQPVRFSDKKGKVFTFSLDNVSSTIDSPAVIAVIDFDSGGRMECFMTDHMVKEVKMNVDDMKIGMDVEMTFRKLFEREEIINYFWKARPVRF
jgi:3-hydroxy-3-methylglutaryl CoA synthase